MTTNKQPDPASPTHGERRGVYAVLGLPMVYRLALSIIAPGAAGDFLRYLREVMTQLPEAEKMLDVGCGPRSWLSLVGRRPMGVDVSEAYVKSYIAKGNPGVAGSADRVPFADDTFDGVWAVALHHHLDENTARASIRSMQRVCAPGGYVVIVDGIFPPSVWRNPLAYLIRRIDRGRFMRSAEQMTRLLPNEDDWQVERFTYGWYRNAGITCIWRKPTDA